MSEAQDHDLLAAEYVLGTLEGEEAQEAARLLRDDPAFAASVRAWEQRLAPLARSAPPAQPPSDLWDRIDSATAEAAVIPMIPRRRLRFWQAGAGAAMAIAASLAAFILVHPSTAPKLAVLTPPDSAMQVMVASVDPDGTLRIQPTGPVSVPADRDLELWALPQGETRPRSLGVLPAAGRQLTASLATGTQLMVSLEPRGGSPTGQPTGPVLWGGRLTAVN